MNRSTRSTACRRRPVHWFQSDPVPSMHGFRPVDGMAWESAGQVRPLPSGFEDAVPDSAGEM